MIEEVSEANKSIEKQKELDELEKRNLIWLWIVLGIIAVMIIIILIKFTKKYLKHKEWKKWSMVK